MSKVTRAGLVKGYNNFENFSKVLKSPAFALVLKNTIVWTIAVVGMVIKAVWITCPKWFSSILYIAMGWVCLGVFGPLWHTLPHSAFLWLLAGGVIYTAGG
ncbi:hypothetical protein DK853_30690, partial [Klebsiella oxytoca]